MGKTKIYHQDNLSKEDLWLLAISEKDIKTIKELLLNGVDVNYQNPYDGNNALMMASQQIYPDVIRFLLNLPNIILDLKNKENENFIDKLIRTKGYGLQFIIDEELQETIIKNNHENILLFVKHNMLHPNIQEKYSYLKSSNDLGLL